MKSYEIQVIVEQDEDGIYVASCPSLQGCYTQAKTFEEVMKRIKDVIAMCIEELKGEKEIWSRRHSMATVRIIN